MQTRVQWHMHVGVGQTILTLIAQARERAPTQARERAPTQRRRFTPIQWHQYSGINTEAPPYSRPR